MPGRGTAWRQGSIVSVDQAQKLGLLKAGEAVCLLVISHDCDLSAEDEHEPDVEVLLGTMVSKADGNFVGGRNARRLHLVFETGQVVDLVHGRRQCIPRATFRELGEPLAEWSLSPRARGTLKQWLGARYARPAFPDAFEARLRTVSGKKMIIDHIDRTFSQFNDHLVGVFFLLTQENELSSDEPYELQIRVAYTDDTSIEVRGKIEEASRGLEKAFEAVFGQDGGNDGIVLDSVIVVSESNFSLATLRQAMQWRLEHVSSRAEDEVPAMPSTDIPA